MVLCYVDDVLEISIEPMTTIEVIKQVFKLKGDKAEPPDMYLGASLQIVETASGEKCWAMSSEKYVRRFGFVSFQLEYLFCTFDCFHRVN